VCAATSAAAREWVCRQRGAGRDEFRGSGARSLSDSRDATTSGGRWFPRRATSTNKGLPKARDIVEKTRISPESAWLAWGAQWLVALAAAAAELK